MARLDFDFHAAPVRPNLTGLVLALAGAACFAWSFHAWQAGRDTEAGLEAQIAGLAQAGPRKPPRPAPGDTLAQEARVRIAAQLAWRWQPAFDALAAAQSKTIALVALDANQAKSQLKITAEARRLEDAIAWIERLQAQAGVKRAVLVQHEVQADADQQPLRFIVQLELAT